MTVTWDQVHAADVLRGADNGLWTVTRRERGHRWASAGAHDVFTLSRDGREVTVTKRLIDPAPLHQRADHTDQSQAWQALTGAGFQLTMLGESMSNEDQFGEPASKRDDGITFDRYKRYVMPHPETGELTAFTRVTTLARTLADEFGLTQWKQRMVARGMAIRPDLIASAAAADPEQDKNTLNSVAQQAMDAAEASKGANFGTAFHKFAQRLDGGEALASLRAPHPINADLAAYVEAMRARSLRVLPEFMERVVCIPSLGACGTLDRIVSQPPGPTHSEPLGVLDLKSGKNLSYSWMEIAIQQALYANATYMWDGANRCWIPMPAVDRSRALIAHSPIGKGQTEIYGVDLIKGWKLAKAAMQVHAWRKDTYSWLVAPENLATVALLKISQAESREALSALYARYQSIWTDELTAAGKQRLESITQ